MMTKPRTAFPSQSGNIFFMLFAAVALVGAFGVAANNMMKGQVAAMSDVTRKTIAEEKMMGGARLAIQQATAAGDAGDCDNDGLVEPLPYADAGAGAHPAGGGWIPADIGATPKDPWGTPYGYCVWDPGDLTLSDAVAGCGGGTARRLQGRGADHRTTPAALSDTVVAIISAGKDRKFSTTCNSFVDTTPADGVPDLPLVQRAAGDDIVIEYSYNDANGLSGDDLWRVRDTKPDTATIDKNIEVAGSATMQGVLELKERGLLLPDDGETGQCIGLNESELRVNGSLSPPVLEICYDGAWVPISMSSSDGESCGETWTMRTAPAGMGAGSRVVYGNNTYVIYAGWPGYIATSPDGVTWTKQDLPPNMSNPGGLAFGNGTFVAVSADHDPVRIATSTDGVTWTPQTEPDNNRWNDVAFGNGMFVAVSWEGAHRVMTSPDGVTWTPQTAPMREWSNIVYGGGRFVAIGGPGLYSMVSSDNGVTWAEAGGDAPYGKITYWNGLFYGNKDEAISSSSDGLVWDTASVPGNNWSGIIGTASRLTMVGWTDAPVTTSLDGVTWTFQNMPMPQRWLGLGHGPDKLVAIGEDIANGGGLMIATSPCSDELYDPSGSGDEDDTLQSLLPDPLVRYNLDETVGTTVYDAMGNANATLSGAAAPPSVAGIIGRGYDLDGSNDVIGVTSSALQALTQYTFSAWIYSPNAGANQSIFDNRNTGTQGVRLWRTTARTLSMSLGTGGSFTTTETVPDNAWTHIAFSYNTAALATAPTIYINGAPATQASFTAPSANTAPTGILQFGLHIGGTFANPGIFDDIRIYPQILNADQVTLLYNDRDSTAYLAPNPVAILAANKYRGKISTGGVTSCGIKEDGSAWCWGDESNGNMGNGPVTAECPSPCRVETQTLPNGFVQVSTGVDFSCGLNINGSIWCWGTDANGQLGNGVTAGTQHYPSPVTATGTSLWTQISVGGTHACGLQNDGRIYCWGNNGSGQLGTGGGSATSPTVVSDAGPWVSVSAGEVSTCGIKVDGSAWCWGNAQYGRLGNGSVASASVTAPTPVLEAGPWVKISRQYRSTCGIKLDGTAWCWGNNLNGQLGNGITGTDKGTPQRVLDYGPWLDIETAMGSAHTCGIKLDGTMWCWGTDADGQLGNGTTVTADQNTPSGVVDPGPWGAVSGGIRTSCGIKADGSAWCWGGDQNGRLGNGGVLTAAQESPSRVANFSEPPAFSPNSAQTLLTKNSAATTISLDTTGGRIGFDGSSGGFGFTGSGRSILANPNGNSGLSIESTGAYDSQLSWKTVTAGATRSIGVDNQTGNLEFGINNAGVTNWMSSITPQMVVNQVGFVGVGTPSPRVRLDAGTGGVRVGADTRTCTLSRKGVIRLFSGALQYCNGTAWTAF